MSNLPSLHHMFDHIHRPHFIFTGQLDDGFCVATVDTDGGKFAIGGSMYPTEEAYKLGNDASVFACGCIHEEVARAVPELAQFIPLHLSSIATGEPDNLRNAFHFLKPDGELAHELSWRQTNGRKNHWSSPDDDSLLHDYFIGLTAKILRVKDTDTVKTLLTERAEEKWPTGLDDEEDHTWTFEEVINSYMLEDIWQALIMFLAPAWMEQAAEFAVWLQKQPEPTQTPADVPSDEFEHTFENGLYVKAVVKDTPISSPIMKGEKCFGYDVTLKYEGVHNAHLSSNGSVADFWQGHHDAKGAAWVILREIGSIHEMGDEYWEEMEINPRSNEARSGNAKAEKFGDAIEANRHIVGY